ncbi:Ficolin-2 [Exaiptasia diaphana]|nr:Ficolin-2 [Exaiptasia diaphana]
MAGDLPIGRYEIRDTSLILRDLKVEDAGVYVCTATIGGISYATAKTKLTLKPAECSSIYKQGEKQNGVYTVWPDNQGKIKVYCDMTTDGGGWTVFQRRKDGSVDFYRNWTDYKRGFGNLTGEFWLGNDFIHRLTTVKNSSLRVDLGDWDGTKIYAKYGQFKIEDEADNYKLRVSLYSGDAGDSLVRHNNKAFSTKDRDNDLYANFNCAVLRHGAWWYYACYDSNLNGKYYYNLKKSVAKGVNWDKYRLEWSLKTTEMKSRPSS